MYIRRRKYTADKNYMVKIILTTFYQKQIHKNFNLIFLIKF